MVYMPFGYGLALWFATPGHGGRSVLTATGFGVLFSLILESVQALLPGRIASNLDILVNGLGALTGALLVLHHGRWLRAGRVLQRWRMRWFHPGLATNIGLAILVLWFMAQFALLPFSGIGWLDLYLRPIDMPPDALDQINLPWLIAVFLEMAVLGAFTANLLRPGHYVGAMLLFLSLAFVMKLLAATILLKLKVVGGVLSLETLAGLLLAFWLLLLPVVSRHRMTAALTCIAVLILTRLLLANHFMPHASFLNIVGLAKHLGAIWPILAGTWLLTRKLSGRLSSRKNPSA
jgi:glycopeptide antibiotics resistance protein